MTEYERQYDYWDSAAGTARRLLEAGLNSAGLRAYVTSRAKSVDHLADKVEQRNRERGRVFTSVAEIESDIADRAGVRIALYFPGQMDEAEKLVRDVLDVFHTRQFPQKADSEPLASVTPAHSGAGNSAGRKRFSGYAARHFRAHIPEASLSEDQARYAKATIEVQVASVLMHAWAEVEHDLVYKPLEGSLSDSEHALLDQLNGLVLAGEIALEQLQKAGDARVNTATAPFRDHYELGEFLRARLAALGQELTDATLGRVDILFRYLAAEQGVTAEAVTPYLKELEQDFERRPVAEQLADLMLSGNEAHYESYNKAMLAIRHPSARPRLGVPNPDASGDAANSSYALFVRAWARLEETLTGRLPETHRGIARQLRAALAADLIDPEQFAELNLLRNLRNEVVHSPSVGVSIDRLNNAAVVIRAIVEHIEKQ